MKVLSQVEEDQRQNLRDTETEKVGNCSGKVNTPWPGGPGHSDLQRQEVDHDRDRNK